jgi:hypothetical protein
LLTSIWIRSLPMIFHSWESTCFDHVNDQWTIWRDLSCFVSSLGHWLAGSGEGNEEVHIKLCRGWWPHLFMDVEMDLWYVLIGECHFNSHSIFISFVFVNDSPKLIYRFSLRQLEWA